MPIGTTVFMLAILTGAADTLALSAADWAPPRRAETLAANAALAAFVHELDRRPPTAMEGGRSGLLPSRGIAPSMEGRSAEREAVSERGLIHWTNAGAVFPPAVLRIRHAGGAAGSGFALQLRDALVALGLPSARTRLVPAAADADLLILEISANGEAQP